jgi:hypothetical protein
MLTASEIRIGNVFNFLSREGFIRGVVTSISATKITLNNKHSVKIKHKDLLPILLTEELFLKCGGSISDGVLEPMYYLKGVGNALKNDDAFFFLVGHVKIKYLHDLQNFYFVMQREEIKIDLA